MPCTVNTLQLSKFFAADTGNSLVPDEYRLEQNYPNPFNPTTEIRFQLPDAGQVELTVYNTLGQEIRTLASGTYDSGVHTVQWDGTNNFGSPVSSGVYFYKIVANKYVALKKMNLMR